MPNLAMRQLSTPEITSFREAVWGYYRDHARYLQWRDDPTPYKVLVSELMLQQTQVARVIPKFDAFLLTFPDFASLAQAPLSKVLSAWSGLGYNRRAKYLHQTAQRVVRDHAAQLPVSQAELTALPGIGKNTAGAIMAYAYNHPAVFVETNIRTVYFHHFFGDAQELVSDRDVAELVSQTLERENPREWYWALMDYGTHLKKTSGARLNTSRHYVKQTPLRGSLREMRGRIIRSLVTSEQPAKTLREMVHGDERFEPALAALEAEGMVSIRDHMVRLSSENLPS